MAVKRVKRKSSELMVVVTSVGTEEQALDVAHALVRAKRAACVKMILR